MAWRLGDEPKKWTVDKGQPILINDYKVMSESTTTMPGLTQKYSAQDKLKEEQRLHKIRQSERDSFNEGILPYGLDNPTAPITSQTQMPYTLAEMILQALTPSLGFTVSKTAQNVIEKSLRSKNTWETFINKSDVIENNAVDIWEAFNKGIKKQEQWSMHPESLAREKIAYYNHEEYLKHLRERGITPKDLTNYLRVQTEVAEKFPSYKTNAIHNKTVALNSDLGNAMARYRRTSDYLSNTTNSIIELDLNKAYNKSLEEIESAGVHEQSHYKNMGGDYYNKQTLKKFQDETVPFNPTNHTNDLYNYYADPTEIHARIDVLRQKLMDLDPSFKPGVTVTPDDIRKLRNLKDDDTITTLAELAYVTKEPNSLVRLMNYLPALGATVPLWKQGNEQQKWKVQ